MLKPLTYYTFLFIILPVTTWAQLTVFPLEGNSNKPEPKKISAARTQEVTPRSLPFWDDFSYAADNHPQDSMWVNNRTVYVNSGQAINPPTINVASFDGLNENGLPYNSTDNLDYGYRDTLESQPIKMTEVTLPLQNSVYLSFFYQAGGHGEPPDPGDFLRLEFKKSDETWEPIATFTTEDDLDPTMFYDTTIQINQAEYFHDDFRFRFISFGRKSGRYDAWHLDYVYLNIRNASDKNASISDRALTKPFTPVLNEYYAQPYAHFLSDPSAHFSKPFFEVNNLKDTTFSQVVNYTSHFKISNYLGGIENVSYNALLDIEEPLPSLPSLARATYQFINLPNTSNFDPLADSAEVTVTLAFNSGDNDEDYYSRYEPIDFFVNDTLRHTFNLSNYYAYDDGIAEYAAGLTTTGNRLAYGFTMKINSQDTINALNIYFSNFVGEHSSTVEFFILDHDNGLPGAILHEQLLQVTPKANNEFSLTELTHGNIKIGVIVKDTFFIGYRQPTGASIRIGLDKSNDSGLRMYDNTNGTWIQNDRITGSLMIRPIFGPGDVTVGLPEVPKPVTIYPNPNRGTFYMKGVVDYVQVVNLTGQAVELVTEDLGDEKRITLPGASSGLYFVRYKSGAKVFTEKLILSK